MFDAHASCAGEEAFRLGRNRKAFRVAPKAVGVDPIQAHFILAAGANRRQQAVIPCQRNA